MNFFNKMKVKKTMLLSFCVVAIFIVIVGAIGCINIKRINSASNQLYNEDLKTIKNLDKFDANTMHLRLEIINLVESRDKNKTADTLKTISPYKDENDRILTLYKQSNLTSEQKTLVSQLDNELISWRTIYNKILNLMAAGKYDDAMLLNKQAASYRNKLTSTIEKLIQITVQNSKSSNIKNNALYTSSLIAIILITIIGLTIAILLGNILASSTGKVLNKILLFANSLSNGDLTKRLSISSKNEFGIISNALNNATEDIKNLVSEITSSIKTINSSSQDLSATTEEISSMMSSVNESTAQIAEGSQNLSSITEEISASSEEMEANTSELSGKANEASKSSVEIKNRAVKIKQKASKSIEESASVYEEKNNKILKAIEDGKVVSEVKTMAASIGNIAEQTNLLALNAAIEAARAGEQGRGFSVVADEVRKLAEESSTTVESINKMVLAVETAFKNLSDSSKEVLEYIANNVKPNYQFLMDTGIQYEKDSEFINTISKEIDSSSKQMHEAVSQVSTAIQSAASTAEESASGSEEILGSVGEVTKAIEEISVSSQSQSEMAEKLSAMIDKFTIN
ncbi:methyl-accepting chemotaxis protein [Clostridium tyrobutyricum]|uniref:Membrane assosiated methyl-accepting chemotaxis protein with HAMP domain n=2 Tax=Clostridium tyrobutyricum TaxID=1519 RepID=W6N435_CLOTY|nr:methyl-accepting chemotaxis protein [Clostridium tyrobutyricum]AND86040.1 methyl-accepting chemotaxis protein [Clostridium tyrobutyricum]ANP70540.1 chemotaxis protein [Clostridium tyrobutyricum]MBV4431786.1 methyl-accepting chemotaxis protein [Clostridium tyrobutyricum]MBV4434959.1 methyl-accepting chemotaxis protein [Clostridium tyrobutyricum]QNB67828.1 methyl-accepting chemotaxis protein [Clostridium tyrobutyricum]